MGKDLTPFVVKTKGCEAEISSISANGLEFSDIEFKSGRLTAKVKATTTSSGAVSFKLVDKDGAETESPNSIFLLVLDAADVHVKTIADKAATTGAVTFKRVKALESRVETVSTTRPTRDEVATAIAPLQKRIADLEKVVVTLQGEVETTNGRIAALGAATAILAEGQVNLGNTQVKKGFWGKKPLNPEVAAASRQIREAFLPSPSPVVAVNN